MLSYIHVWQIIKWTAYEASELGQVPQQWRGPLILNVIRKKLATCMLLFMISLRCLWCTALQCILFRYRILKLHQVLGVIFHDGFTALIHLLIIEELFSADEIYKN
jgi:hypothetical protein